MQRPSDTIKSDLISVIIPSFNHGRYLHESIESAYLQKNVVVEIIVVDDGSTDNTKQVADQHPYVKYIYQS
ncbi:MAG: glycosyltransferase, partial [Flavobacterium sp.]